MMVCAVVAGGCDGNGTSRTEPPVARVEPTELELHGTTRIDDYYWLKEREDPVVVEYLAAENAYLETFRDYYYQARYEQGKEYPVHVRREGSIEGPEEVMVDVNALASGHEYFSARVGVSGISEDQRILAFATDSVGRRKYTIRFLDLDTGGYLADEIPDVTPNVAWAADNRTLLVPGLPSHPRYRSVGGRAGVRGDRRGVQRQRRAYEVPGLHLHRLFPDAVNGVPIRVRGGSVG